MTLVLALDLGRRTGYQLGRAGEMPFDSGAWALAKQKEPIDVAIANLGCAIRDLLHFNKPDVFVIEHFMNPAAPYAHADAVVAQLQMHGVVLGWAGPVGATVSRPSPQEIRKHFIGKASAGTRVVGRQKTSKERAESRAATKAAVVKRAIQLGYVSTYDEDKADAAAIYDYYLSAVLWQKPKNQPFKLFGE